MMRTTVLFSLVFLLAAGCQPSPEPAAVERTPKVLLIGLDGVRVDRLAAADTPEIDLLIAEGFYSDVARTRMPTVSGPGWSSMVNGVWAEKHGVMGNNFSSNRYDRYPDFLTRLEQLDPAWDTFAVLDWPPLGTTADGGPMISDTVDVKVNLNGETMGYPEGDARSCEIAEAYLAVGKVDAAFVYLGDIDVAAHATTSFSPEYTQAMEWADGCLGRLLGAVRGRASYPSEDWLILMSTDHGRNDEGGHGGDSENELTIFVLAHGGQIQPGSTGPAEIVDVSVTALAHLGVEILPEWDLDGRDLAAAR